MTHCYVVYKQRLFLKSGGLGGQGKVGWMEHKVHGLGYPSLLMAMHFQDQKKLTQASNIRCQLHIGGVNTKLPVPFIMAQEISMRGMHRIIKADRPVSVLSVPPAADSISE